MQALRGSICHRNIESMFLYHASPILCNVKPAVLVTVRPECTRIWKSRKDTMCKATGLCIREIKRKNGVYLFLIYEKHMVDTAIKNETSANILKMYNYPVDEGIENCINHLTARFEDNDFPHEIGIFLGYPPGDVKAFIENEGKNSTCCRYWKVYEDVETAQSIWAKIDEAQCHAIDVLKGFPPLHIAVNMLRTAQLTRKN